MAPATSPSDQQSNQRSRGWCFTENNPTFLQLSPLDQWAGAEYRVYQKERGASGTPHFQGYVYFKNAKTMSAVKKLLPRAYLAPSRGTPLENKTYCTKEAGRIDGPWESGTIPQQGARTDLDTVAVQVVENRSLDGVPPGMMVRYRHGLNGLLWDQMKPRWRTFPTVYWIYGPTSTGKSEHVCDIIEGKVDGSNVYKTNHWVRGLDRCMGYKQQEVFVLEELRAKNWPYDELLGIMDQHPYTLYFKYGSCEFNSPIIIVTSCKSPQETYFMQDDRDNCTQLMRRIHKIIHLTKRIGPGTAPQAEVEG